MLQIFTNTKLITLIFNSYYWNGDFMWVGDLFMGNGGIFYGDSTSYLHMYWHSLLTESFTELINQGKYNHNFGKSSSYLSKNKII